MEDEDAAIWSLRSFSGAGLPARVVIFPKVTKPLVDPWTHANWTLVPVLYIDVKNYTAAVIWLCNMNDEQTFFPEFVC